MTKTRIIAVIGGIGAFFAIVLNLASGMGPQATKTLTIEGAIAAAVALACGVYLLRAGPKWRFAAIALIGPGIFVLAELGMMSVMFLSH